MPKTNSTTHAAKSDLTKFLPEGYTAWLQSLKGRIHAARSRATLAADGEMIRLYHQIGQDILERQVEQGWGSKVIASLARDLKDSFPDMKCFSVGNIKYMRYFAENCPDGQIGQQPADQLPWFHIVTLLTKATSTEREWYARQAVIHGWSRLTLELHIQNRLVAQYAVNGIDKPIGVAECHLMKGLPEVLAKNLPSIEDIEAEFTGPVLVSNERIITDDE